MDGSSSPARSEQRAFAIAPTIIQHLIKAQAGSCGKAIAECLMNSIDAGATRVDIDLSRMRMSITDDGEGFRTRESILQTFEVFGFDHEGLDRTYGKFGLGRGQMWNFCSTVWRTRTFSMDVDIRSRGLHYELVEDLADVPGLRIDAVFYSELSAVDEHALVREIEDLCKFCAIPVTVNGRTVTKNPQAEKWTVETDEAFVKVVPNAWGMKVYNQGIYVCEIPTRQGGVGGVLCTKRGQNLELNMARNDVLRKSPAWLKLMGLCKTLAGERIDAPQRVSRLTDSERGFLVHQLSDPEATHANLERPIFTLCDGRHVTLAKLDDLLGGYHARKLTVSEPGSRIGERMMRDRNAVVLSTDTLVRFGVDTLTQMIDRLEAFVASAAPPQRSEPVYVCVRTAHDRVARLRKQAVDDIKDVPAFREINAKKVPEDELKPDAKAFRQSIENLNAIACAAVCEYTDRNGRIGRRKLIIGRSDGCDAYTDGQEYVALTEHTVEAAIRDGVAGMLRVGHLLVHEYLHDDDDVGSHQHDLTFYESYHNIILDLSSRLHEAALAAFASFANGRARISRRHASQIDRAERALKHVAATASASPA